MYPTTNLQPGMSGPEVVKLQNFLKGQGMSIPSGSTGYFGNETKAALSQWQSQTGVQAGADAGYWGPKSIAVASGVNSSKAPVASFAPSTTTNPPLTFAPSTNTNTSSSSTPSTPSSTLASTLGFNGVSPEQAAALVQYGVNANQWNTTGSEFHTPWLKNAMNIYKPPATPVSSTPTSKTSEPDIQKAIDDALHAIIGSGYAINPGLTPEDIAAIDPAKFMESAAATIAPEYQQKFAVASDTLKRALGNTQEDYAASVAKTNRAADESLLTGTETLAGRGLSFSGARDKFTSDVGYERNLALGEAAQTAQRTGQTALGTAEGLIGTSATQGLGINTSIGGRNLSFSSTPIVGQYNSEKAYTTESIARQLASQEAQRRAYATRQLSFA